MTDAEKKLAKIMEQNRLGTQRYRERHKIRAVRADITQERYDLLISKLKEKGLTQKQFIENAIDKFLEE